MTKTKEELNELKKELEVFTVKFKELTSEELLEVFGGGEEDEQLFYFLFESPNYGLTGIYSLSQFEDLIKNNKSLRLKPYSAYGVYNVYEKYNRPMPDFIKDLLMRS